MAELSIRYATALFELSLENGSIDECFEQAVVVRDILKTDDCRKIMEHPHISGDEKRTFLHEAFSGSLNPHLNGFLHLLIAKNRESIMPSSLSSFIEMTDSFKGRAKAGVVSAVQLDDNQIAALQSTLSRKMRKKVEMSLKVDPSLIGGLYIYADGCYINRTIKEQLSEMKKSIKSACTKSLSIKR